MILLIIDIASDKPDKIKFSSGDILVFYNGTEYDYHQIVYDNKYLEFRLLALSNGLINDGWEFINKAIEDLNVTKNGFKLIKILKPSEVVLRRVSNE